MPEHYLHIETNRPGDFFIDVTSAGEEPTEDEIDEAVEELAQQMTYEGYMAELATNVGYHVIEDNEQPVPKSVVLVIRDPDASNDFVIEGGPVKTIDLDLGRVDLAVWDEFAPWADSHLRTAAGLPEDSVIRQTIEGVVVAQFFEHERLLTDTYRRSHPEYTLPEITGAADLREVLLGEDADD